jgi:hypothetical protein
MNKLRCPQCGAQLHGDVTCAERLYRMLTSGGIAQARIGEAFAQFALSHPMTYSNEALQVAQDLLTPRREPDADVDESTELSPTHARSWWRHLARRTSCH